MKKYLMTWYGITDLRASLALEHTTGPVLGALLAEDYTNVNILGFTNQDKSNKEVDAFQQKIVSIEKSDTETIRQFLDLFSNTKEAHNHFIHWLQKRLWDAGKKVEVHFYPVGLKHLNDTEGIYETAIQSLNTVSAVEGEKLVTLYLSPGTPVMAFVWAFAALRYPNLKKRLIASSQPERPPEEIVLPNEWLEWHGRQIRTTKTDPDKYDVIFHLFGEQRMPNLLGVIQFLSRKHIFVNSTQFPADVMKQFLGEAEYGEIAVDPYDPENVRSTILDNISRMPANIRIGFNLTGGTKLMYAGALAACRKVNATPFYFDSRNDKVIFLNNFYILPVKFIESVETIITLNANNLVISDPGRKSYSSIEEENELFSLSGLLWQRRFVQQKGCQWDDSLKRISFKDDKGLNHTVKFKDFNTWKRYLNGHWLEEYVFLLLKNLVVKGLIKDLRTEMKISFIKGSPYQELDVVFTDGKKLYIVECKTSSISGNDLSKLDAVIREFGGLEGKGILLTCKTSPDHGIKQKVKNYRNIFLISGDSLLKQIEAIIKSGGNNK